MSHSSLPHASASVSYTAPADIRTDAAARRSRWTRLGLDGVLLASLMLGSTACSDTGATTGTNGDFTTSTNTGSAVAPTGDTSATTVEQPMNAGGFGGDDAGPTTGGEQGASTAGSNGLDTTGTGGDVETTGATPADAGMGSTGGGETDATTGAVEPTPREDLGEGTGSDVITIGDSWMSLFLSGIQQSLVAVSGQPYRTYGVPGTRLLDEVIPGQYADAKQDDPEITTVIMTGGGNDIIQSAEIDADCDVMGPLCEEQVTMILDRLESLWAEMAADGVQDVVYVQYANPEGMSIDFALQDGDSVVTRCEAVPEPLRCHTLETLDIVMGDIPDGIHPSAAGYDRIGQAVYDLMVAEGMRR